MSLGGIYLFMLTPTRSLRSFPDVVTRPTNILNTNISQGSGYYKKRRAVGGESTFYNELI